MNHVFSNMTWKISVRVCSGSHQTPGSHNTDMLQKSQPMTKKGAGSFDIRGFVHAEFIPGVKQSIKHGEIPKSEILSIAEKRGF